jgi:hypothetical protein
VSPFPRPPDHDDFAHRIVDLDTPSSSLPPTAHPGAPETAAFWQKAQRDVRATDEVSFFIGGNVFRELDALQILRHNALHLSNVITKMCLATDDDLPNWTPLRDEVVPDAWIYGIQFANAFGIDPAAAYSQVAGYDIDDLPSLDRLAQAQRAHDRGLGSWTRGMLNSVRSIRHRLASAVLSVTRIADKHDHGERLPDTVRLDTASGLLMMSAMQLGDLFDVDVEHSVHSRLGTIRDKYGDVTRRTAGGDADIPDQPAPVLTAVCPDRTRPTAGSNRPMNRADHAPQEGLTCRC